MTLAEFINKKNGVPFGHPKSLRNNLYRALGAKNFSDFWTYWNPIFGYYLGTKVYRPLKKYIPANIALILTFVFCGSIHDLVTTLIRKQISLFFSVWFFIMVICVIITKITRYNLSTKKWIVRAMANTTIIGLSFYATHLLNHILHFY